MIDSKFKVQESTEPIAQKIDQNKTFLLFIFKFLYFILFYNNKDNHNKQKEVWGG